MKSGENGLIGKGDNNYGKDDKPKLITKLTPELSEKIFRAFKKKQYDDAVSKQVVLHHLKQLKAQMGKELKIYSHNPHRQIVRNCMNMIDKKIAKVNR